MPVQKTTSPAIPSGAPNDVPSKRVPSASTNVPLLRFSVKMDLCSLCSVCTAMFVLLLVAHQDRHWRVKKSSSLQCLRRDENSQSSFCCMNLNPWCHPDCHYLLHSVSSTTS